MVRSRDLTQRMKSSLSPQAGSLTSGLRARRGFRIGGLDIRHALVRLAHVPGLDPAVLTLEADVNLLAADLVVEFDAVGVAVVDLEIDQHVPEVFAGGRSQLLGLDACRAGLVHAHGHVGDVVEVGAPVGDHALAVALHAHPVRPLESSGGRGRGAVM
jgi:hypothetical protein